jgi:hypothetical protein
LINGPDHISVSRRRLSRVQPDACATAYENVEYPLLPVQRVPAPERRQRVLALRTCGSSFESDTISELERIVAAFCVTSSARLR